MRVKLWGEKAFSDKGFIPSNKTYEWRRMGRSDVVARMLIEMLDEDCMKAVVEALAGLRTEEAIQAVVQVSLTLASADRPDVIADVSAPALPVPPFLSLCRVLTQVTRHWGRMIRYLDCIAAALAAHIQRSAHTRQRLCGLLPKEVRCLYSKALNSGGNVVQPEAVPPGVQSLQSCLALLYERADWCRSRLRWLSMGVWSGLRRASRCALRLGMPGWPPPWHWSFSARAGCR